ncbi:MAG: glycosyltransferase family 4 protein [Chloroflexota bacterium]
MIVYDSIDTVSGGYLYDRQLVQALLARGAEIEVFSLPWRRYPLRLTDNLSASFARSIENASLDLLLQDELNHPSLLWLNRRFKERCSCPIVSIVHHPRSVESRPDWQNRLYAIVERAYLRGIDAFVFNSHTTARAVFALTGARRPSIIAYPSGNRSASAITWEQIHQRAHQPPPLQMMFLGNVIPRKGLDTLVRALSHLPAALWNLTVVGSLTADHDYVQLVRNLVHRRGLDGKVHLLGSLPDAELTEVLSGSQVLAIPSQYEGFGIAYLEGMSVGLPAIGTTAGGAAEVISDGVDGFLVPPEQPRALARVIRCLAQDRRLLERMSCAAFARAKRHPGWESSMAVAAEFLDGVAS